MTRATRDKKVNKILSGIDNEKAIYIEILNDDLLNALDELQNVIMNVGSLDEEIILTSLNSHYDTDGYWVIGATFTRYAPRKG